MALSVILNKPIENIIKDSGINDVTALYAAHEAGRLMYDYVPMKTGALCDTAKIFTENGRGIVYYIQAYAAYCYYGDKKTFNRDRHEKASAYWDKAMILSQRGELTRSVGNFIKKKK